MSDSKRDIVDHWSFVEGVKSPLGRLADACLNAYKEKGDTLLEEAANALRAIETVDLTGVNKCYPCKSLPWHIRESGYDQTDTPILSANARPILVRDSGYYPPELPISEAIVECMNTVHALQTKTGD